VWRNGSGLLQERNKNPICIREREKISQDSGGEGRRQSRVKGPTPKPSPPKTKKKTKKKQLVGKGKISTETKKRKIQEKPGDNCRGLRKSKENDKGDDTGCACSTRAKVTCRENLIK